MSTLRLSFVPVVASTLYVWITTHSLVKDNATVTLPRLGELVVADDDREPAQSCGAGRPFKPSPAHRRPRPRARARPVARLRERTRPRAMRRPPPACDRSRRADALSSLRCGPPIQTLARPPPPTPLARAPVARLRARARPRAMRRPSPACMHANLAAEIVCV